MSSSGVVQPPQPSSFKSAQEQANQQRRRQKAAARSLQSTPQAAYCAASIFSKPQLPARPPHVLFACAV